MIRLLGNPRWRYVGLLVVLSLILGGTLALAAWVARQRQLGLLVPLSPPQTYGNLQLSLPEGWQVSAGTESDAPLVVQAREPADPDASALSGRRIFLLRDRTAALYPPLQYLSEKAPLPDAGQARAFSPLTLAGSPGVLVQQARIVRDGDTQFVEKRLLACTVLPSRLAITLGLEGFGSITPSDVALIKRVAESLALNPSQTLLPARSASRIELFGGISVPVPDDFLILDGNDPNFIQHHLLLNPRKGAWAAAELVPFVLPPASSPVETLRAVLIQRESLWREARVQELSTRSWQVDPVGREHFPLRLCPGPRRRPSLAGDLSRGLRPRNRLFF